MNYSSLTNPTIPHICHHAPLNFSNPHIFKFYHFHFLKLYIIQNILSRNKYKMTYLKFYILQLKTAHSQSSTICQFYFFSFCHVTYQGLFMNTELIVATATTPIMIKKVLKYEPLASYNAPAIVPPNEANNKFILIIG